VEGPFVPSGFVVPLALATEQFRLEPLGPQHNDSDYEAWSSSVEHIHNTPGWQTSSWPDDRSLVDNLRDLQGHADDFENRSGFTYTVLDPATSDVIGCVYIYPDDSEQHDARVRSWVRASRSELDVQLWRAVTDWLAKARHPKTGRLFTEMVYQPMLELLAYLRANGFKTFIVSAGGIEFMRIFSERVYGVPPEQVIGTSIRTKFELRDGKPVLVRLPEMNFINDGEGKPVGIQMHIGRRPVAAFGNADGDLQMLQWTAAGSGPRFCLYIHHTDADREWAYDRTSGIGKLDKAWDEAVAKGWTVVDMKKDWKRIYPFAQ